MSDIAVSEQQGGTLALTGDQVEWSPVQRAALDHLGIADAPSGDQQVFLHVSQRTGLDPFAKQIYMIPRQEGQGQQRRTKWTIQTAIDGFRLIASRSRHYRGQVGPQWCGDDGVWQDVWISSRPPAAARVGILRDDFDEPIWGVAIFREYAQTTTWNNEVKLTKMWREKSAHMIAKCAEALGLRKAFPNELSGMYTDDEMARADSAPATAARRVVDHGPAITAAELTGQAPPATAAPPAAEQASQAAPPAEEKPARKATARKTRKVDPEPTGPAGDKPDAKAMSKLFALIGKSDIDDRQDWASGVLGRDVDTFAKLTAPEVSRLIDRLENPPADDEPIDAELVEDEPIAEQLQREAEADAARDDQ
jgi:phage recombination protein Bet